MITTANYFTKGIKAIGIAISVGKPRWWTGRSYPPLAPAPWMLRLQGQEFTRAYQDTILSQLDPIGIREELEGSALLCWEGFNTFCHRRLVAEWLETEAGIVVPEYGRNREESLVAADMPSKSEAKRQKLAASELF
ncbi:MAG: hypothetical protein R3B95_11760 [Nitrospirales bacterium]|nr:hypothetical protein [Nitrospirales bacterium]